MLFSESLMNNLQSVSIIAVFPLGAAVVLIALSFLKDANLFIRENQTETTDYPTKSLTD